MGRISSKITSIEPGDLTIEPSVDDTIKAIAPQDEPTTKPAVTEAKLNPLSEPDDISDSNSLKFGWIPVVSGLTGLAWLAMLGYIAVSLLKIPSNLSTFSALDWLVISAFVFLPIITVFIGTYALRQLARLSSQSARIERLGNALTTPDKTVIGKSKSLAAAIANQIGEIDLKMTEATAQLDGYQSMIAGQVETLSLHNAQSEQTSSEIAQAIKHQAKMLDDIAGSFDSRMDALSDMLTRQSENLTNSSHMAEQKLKEARISVEGAAAKINSASDIVRNNIVQASSSLTGSHQDIQSLGEIIQQRSRELDEVYKKHAAELTEMIEQLRDEQQILGSNLEERLRKMRDMSLSAQTSAESLIKASDAGRETVHALSESASLADKAVKARFNEMQEMVKYSSENAQSISDKAAQRVKDSLEITRKEIIRIEHDMVDLQARLEGHSRRSLELVAEDNPAVPEPEDKPKRRRWSRLTLKPLPEEEPDAPTFLGDELPAQGHPERNPAVPEPEEPSDTQGTVQPALELDEIEPVTTDTLRRTLPDTDKRTSKSKSGFRLKNLFGGGDKSEDASLSITNANSGTLDRAIFADLNALGIPPNAVVDDGCIIEAVNNRVAKGRGAMRDVINLRLKGPVEHLANNLVQEPAMRARAQRYCATYDETLQRLQGNREAIRTRLESEDGRAYLLCDAALNPDAI